MESLINALSEELQIHNNNTKWKYLHSFFSDLIFQ